MLNAKLLCLINLGCDEKQQQTTCFFQSNRYSVWRWVSDRHVSLEQLARPVFRQESYHSFKLWSCSSMDVWEEHTPASVYFSTWRQTVGIASAGSTFQRMTSTQEPVNLTHDHLQRPVAILHAIRSWERLRRGHDVVGVDSCFAVEPMPHNARQVEQNGLQYCHAFEWDLSFINRQC